MSVALLTLLILRVETRSASAAILEAIQTRLKVKSLQYLGCWNRSDSQCCSIGTRLFKIVPVEQRYSTDDLGDSNCDRSRGLRLVTGRQVLVAECSYPPRLLRRKHDAPFVSMFKRSTLSHQCQASILLTAADVNALSQYWYILA